MPCRALPAVDLRFFIEVGNGESRYEPRQLPEVRSGVEICRRAGGTGPMGLTIRNIRSGSLRHPIVRAHNQCQADKDMYRNGLHHSRMKRSEEGRVGKEGDSMCNSRVAP